MASLPNLSRLRLESEAMQRKKPRVQSNDAHHAHHAHQLAMQLRVRRQGEAMLKTAWEAGQPVRGQEYQLLWTRLYTDDRRKRKQARATGQTSSDEYDYRRTKTPPRRVRVDLGNGANHWHSMANEQMNDEEYVNYRRGYEMEILRLERRRMDQRGKKWPWLASGKQLDRVIYGSESEEPVLWASPTPGKYEFEKFPGIYYEITSSSSYILDIRNAASFELSANEVANNQKDARSISKLALADAFAAEEAERVAAVARAEAQAAQKAERAAAEKEAIRVAAQAAQEAAKLAEKQREAALQEEEFNNNEIARVTNTLVAKTALDATLQHGDFLHGSHVVIPLYDYHADCFYRSMALLYTKRKGHIPNLVETMRTNAMIWIRFPPKSPRFLSKWNGPRHKQLFNGGYFKKMLYDSSNPDSILVPGPGIDSLYTLGIRRVGLQIMDAKGPGKDLSNEKNIYLPNGFMAIYTNVQNTKSSWATLYEVEAIAWQLNTPIYLYANSPLARPNLLSQDWNSLEPRLKIGPPATADNPPYRLLWSADDNMRFRPLVDRYGDPVTTWDVEEAKQFVISTDLQNPDAPSGFERKDAEDWPEHKPPIHWPSFQPERYLKPLKNKNMWPLEYSLA